MRKATNSTFAGKLETMRRIYAIFCAISLTLTGLFSSGATLAADNFFAEAVAVENRSAGELKRAAGAALTRVLIRISGNEQILDETAFSAAVNDAQSHVLLYSYQDDAEVGTFSNSTTRLFEAYFAIIQCCIGNSDARRWLFGWR